MKTLPTLILAAAITCLATINLSADTLSIAGTSNIFGAGHASAPGGGTLPPFVNFAVGQTLLTFSTVTGMVTINVGTGSNANNPDGIGAAPTDSSTTSVGGISGITAPHAGYLVGVFLTSTEPGDPPPASLDFTSIGTNFTTLSPVLDQTFFIGDGLTGNGAGAQQQFVIPAGATRLFLGIADASGFHGAPGSYGDNTGSFSATFSIVPEPSTWAMVIAGVITILCAKRLWRTPEIARNAPNRIVPSR